MTLGLASVTDPNGNTTTSVYDSAGNLLSTTDPLRQTTSHTYNRFGEVTSMTDANGVTITNNFDSKGNLLSTSTPIGNSKAKTTYTYSTTKPGDVVSVTTRTPRLRGIPTTPTGTGSLPPIRWATRPPLPTT